MREALGVDEDDSAGHVRDRLERIVRGEDGAELIAARVAELMRLAEPRSPAEEIAWAVRKLLESVARSGPVVVVVDLHWGEPTFLELVEHVADWSRDSPILLVVAARPELFELRPGWGGGKVNATTFMLESLSTGESASLLKGLLGAPIASTVAADRVMTAAEGNPLFLEEIVGMLIDDGLLGGTVSGGPSPASFHRPQSPPRSVPS